VPATQTAQAIAACAAADIACHHIGTVVADPAERLLCSPDGTQLLPTFAPDEILKIFQGKPS
jgi:hypothetical protein